jgi:hypothetical protein
MFSSFVFSQKIKEKDGIISVDGSEYVKYKEDKVSKYCYIISNLKGEDLFYIRLASYHDENQVKPMKYGGETSGTVSFFEVLSPDLETIYYETHVSGSPFNSFKIKYVIENFFNGEVINTDGTINFNKLELLSKKIGFEYSDKKANLTKTIIIKEEAQPQRARNNFNLRIGN